MKELYIRFPQGKAKALTLSYDDGVEQDIILLQIMQKYGLKGTFNLNSGLYAKEGEKFEKGMIHRRLSKSKAIEIFRNSGQEIAIHGLNHPYYTQIPMDAATYEIVKDRENLESQFDSIIRGSAYPFGNTNTLVKEALRKAGIVYSRTVESTHKFDLPEDWLMMPATCHHKDPLLMELGGRFVEWDKNMNAQFFCLWGHSFEFEADNNWNVIESFAEYIGGRHDIWYATTIEICDYANAFKNLRFSYDRKIVENPTSTVIWFYQNESVIKINPGERLIL